MECFGFSCRFKKPNILKQGRGDSEQRRQRKADREPRYHGDDDSTLRNGIWRAISQAVEESRIPSLARNFNDWFSKHFPGRQRRDNSTATPRERSQQAVCPDRPDVGNEYKLEDFASTSGIKDHIPASRKPRVARVKPVSKRRLSVQHMDGDTTEDQGQHTASVALSDVGDGKDRTRRRKTVIKISKSRKKDITITDGSQYLEAEKLRNDFPFHQGEENINLHLWKPALPPNRTSPSEVVIKKRQQNVKHVSNTIQEPTECEDSPQHPAVDTTDAVAEEHDEPPDSTDLPPFGTMEDAIEAVAMAQNMSFASPDLTEDWVEGISQEGEEDEYTDTPEWEVIMTEVPGIKGILQPKQKEQLGVKKSVRIVIEEDHFQDSLSQFLKSRDDKPNKPLCGPKQNEAWPLQNKNEFERRCQFDRKVEKKLRAGDTTYARQAETRIRIKGKNKYTKHEAVGNTNLSAQELDDAHDFDVDEAIADILRNMGDLP